jgi:hypothetical protein
LAITEQGFVTSFFDLLPDCYLFFRKEVTNFLYTIRVFTLLFYMLLPKLPEKYIYLSHTRARIHAHTRTPEHARTRKG